MASPIRFKEHNLVLRAPTATPDEKVTNIAKLAVWTDGEQCVSCWRLTWRERISALFFGRVWLAVLSGKTQPPIYAEAKRTFFRTA